MNERIKELEKQSVFYNEDEEIWEIDHKKFAELIIRDCADLFEVEWGNEKLTGNDVGSIVKKHFGVDE